MELSEYTETLRREIAAVTRFAGEDVARAGQMIADALDSSIRLTLLDVLASAAAEITSRLEETAIELRLSSSNPTFAVVQRPPPAPPAPPPPQAHDGGGERNVAGVTAPPGRAEGQSRGGSGR